MATRLAAYLVALIVGTTFIAGLIVGAQRDDEGPVDVMVLNGRVYTADGKGTMAEAVAIQGNKILRVGTTREIQRLKRAQTVVIDANGGAVLPGFIESEAHAATRVVDDLLPRPTRLEERAALLAATADAHRRGITSVQHAGGTARAFEVYDELRREGLLALRVYGALSAGSHVSQDELEEFDELRAEYSDDPLFKAGAVQIVVDGTSSASLFTPEALNGLVAELDKRTWQITIRAIGDRALAMALDAFQHAVDANPAPARGRRHQIEPDGIVGPVDMAPFDDLGMTYPAGEPRSLQQAIDAVTRNAAWASFDEHRKGILARDMLADLVVLSQDIFSLPDARLTDADVAVTIFDGKVVFQKAAPTTN